MKNDLKVLDALLEEYASLRHKTRLPPINVHVEALLPESFRVSCQAGEISIFGCDSRALAYGVSQINIAVRSGHLAEHLGVTAPRFPLRPLWLGAQCKVALSACISLDLPKFFLSERSHDLVDWLCRRLIQGGYNALLLGSRNTDFTPQTSIETRQLDESDFERLKATFQALQEAGVKLIFKPDFSFFHPSGTCFKSPYDPLFCGLLEKLFHEFFEMIPFGKSLFWESMLFGSNYRYHPKAHAATELEAVVEELQLVERCLLSDMELIFYIPVCGGKEVERQARWFPSLIDEMGKSTVFAFPAVAGEISEDSAPNHPFWDILRKSPDSSATPLLPILNLGLVRQGEGLWPTINSDVIERFLPRCRQHVFAGIMAFWNDVPAEGTILDCSFWMAGSALWRDMPAPLLAETWFAAFRPEEDFSACWRCMQAARSISLDLFHLRSLAWERGRSLWNSEEYRLLAESLIGQIKALQPPPVRAFVCKTTCAHPTVAEALPFFVADVARFLHHLMPVLSISSFRGLNVEHDGFWSRKSKDQASTADACFPLEPLCGNPGTVMEAIYRTSRSLTAEWIP